MTVPDPEASTPPGEAPRRIWWRMLIPHLLTAAVAIIGSLVIQATLLRPATPQVILPTPVPTLLVPTATPQPTVVGQEIPPSVDIVRQDIADLQAGQEQLWTAVYLARAINQISDAEANLRLNDLSSVDQTLIAVDDSLGLAYARADSSMKDPIAERRREVDRIREDLFLRPEGMDLRLSQLRSLILSLVEARS